MTVQFSKMWQLAVVAGTAAFTGISCSQSAQTTSAPLAPVVEPAASQPIGAHWVQDQRLRLVMAQLSSRNPSWPAGLPQEPEAPGQGKPAQFDEVASLAAALETAADGLPDVANRIKMTEADRRGFLAEAHTLRDQADALQRAAQQRRIEQMQVQMDLINSTCISCHSRYRDFSGQLHQSHASAIQLDLLAFSSVERP